MLRIRDPNVSLRFYTDVSLSFTLQVAAIHLTLSKTRSLEWILSTVSSALYPTHLTPVPRSHENLNRARVQ